jgi:lycopene beta-cyclase
MSALRSEYEYVIVGGGISGLTLAHFLADELTPDSPILIIDKDDDPDYNISFWTDEEPPFAPIMKKSWDQITVRYGEKSVLCPLERNRLYAFWRDDFDEFLHERLSEHANVRMYDAAVTDVTDQGDHVDVATT